MQGPLKQRPGDSDMNSQVAKQRTVQVIDLSNYADVWFWSGYLEVTAAQLVEAVSRVGREMDAVRRYLADNARQVPPAR